MTTFPKLKLSELMTALSEEYPELGIMEDDFLVPKKECWELIFIKLLAVFADKSVDSVNTNIFQAMDGVEFINEHQDSIRLAILTRCMHRVLLPAGVEDFSLMDIINPKTKRLVLIMSAMLNYLRYNRELMQKVSEIKAKAEERIKHFEHLQAHRDMLITKINSIKATQAEEESKITAAKDEKDVKLKRLCELQKAAQASQAASVEAKSKIAELTSEATATVEQIESDKRELDRLDSHIVQSPERAKIEQADMEEKLKKLKAAAEDKLRSLQGMKTMRQLQRSQECVQARKILDELCEAEERERQIMMEMKKIDNEKQSRSGQCVDLEGKYQLLQRQLLARQEKQDKLQLQCRVKEDALRAQIQDAQSIIEKLEADDDRVRMVEEQRRQLKQKLSEMRDEFSKRMSVLVQDRNTLLESVDSYNKMLSEALASVVEKSRD